MFDLNKALEALQDKKEFAVIENNDTVVIDYIVIAPDTFGNDEYGKIRKNFRGIVFNKNNGEIISLPFHKFFNLNQTEDTQFNLHKDKKAVVYEKLDGSMVHFYRMPDGAVTASTCRSTTSTQAIDAKRFAFDNPHLLQKIVESIDRGFTPLFEWVAPHNQIVCYYKEPRLVYLNSRNRTDGSYLFEEKYSDKAYRYDINFSDILNNVDEPGIEGYVCHLSCGNIIKVKTPWYLTRHRVVDVMMSPKYKIMDLALEGCLDDVIPNAPDNHRAILEKIDSEVRYDILTMHEALTNEFKELTKDIDMSDRPSLKKEIAMICKSSPNFSAMMMIHDNKDPKPFIRKRLYEKYKSLYSERLIHG